MEGKMSEESRMMLIPAGSLLTITLREYSDYSVIGVFRAMADIDPDRVRGQWLQDHPDEREECCFEEYKFLAWIAACGLIQPLECYEWHLGNYGCISHMSVEKNDASLPRYEP
jgi:hypothetical protein